MLMFVVTKRSRTNKRVKMATVVSEVGQNLDSRGTKPNTSNFFPL